MHSKLHTLFLMVSAGFWTSVPATTAIDSAVAPQGATELATGEAPKVTLVDCGKLPSFKSKEVSSAWLISPDEHHRARTQVKAETHGNSSSCVNRSSLLIANSEKSKPKSAFVQQPSEMEAGNTIRLVDWSLDGSSLAFEVVRFQYGSDAPADYDVLVYDLRSKSVIAPKFDELISGIPEGCLVETHGLGFMPDGRLIVQVLILPYYDPDESEPRNRSCGNQHRLWAFNVETARAEQLTPDFQVTKYGKAR